MNFTEILGRGPDSERKLDTVALVQLLNTVEGVMPPPVGVRGGYAGYVVQQFYETLFTEVDHEQLCDGYDAITEMFTSRAWLGQAPGVLTIIGTSSSEYDIEVPEEIMRSGWWRRKAMAAGGWCLYTAPHAGHGDVGRVQFTDEGFDLDIWFTYEFIRGEA